MDLDTSQPFPRWQGLRAGISRATLDGPGYQRVLHGVLVASGVPLTPHLRARAALVCFFPHAFASHATAARVWGAPIATMPGEHVTVPTAGERLRREGVTCHVRAGAEAVVQDGVRVSSLPDLFVELAGQVPLVELVVLGDWMVRRKGLAPVVRPNGRGLPHGDPAAHAHRARRPARAPGQPHHPRRGRGAGTTLRPQPARGRGHRRVRRSAPRRARRPAGARPRETGGDRRPRLADHGRGVERDLPGSGVDGGAGVAPAEGAGGPGGAGPPRGGVARPHFPGHAAYH